MFFKNKKYFFYSLIILILLFLILNNFRKVNDFQKVEKVKKEIKKVEILKKKDNKDTDGDGLYDWQEILYKTDLEKIDTDGDGISDFDEVNQNRDPLTFGVGNEEKIEILKNTKKNTIGIEEQKRLLEEEKREAKRKAKKRYEEFLQKNNLKNIDKEKELSFKNNLNADFKKDLNKMGNIYLDFQDRFASINLEILDGIFKKISKLEKLNQGEKKYLKKYADLYLIFSNRINSLNIKDEDLREKRKKWADGYKKLSEVFKNFAESKENTNKFVQANFKLYSNATNEISLSRKEINILIEARGVRFNSYEPGKIFLFSN